MNNINRLELGELLGGCSQLKKLLQRKVKESKKHFIFVISNEAAGRMRQGDQETLTAILSSTFWEVKTGEDQEDLTCWVSFGGRVLVQQQGDQFYSIGWVVSPSTSEQLLKIFSSYEESSSDSFTEFLPIKFGEDAVEAPVGIDSILQSMTTQALKLASAEKDRFEKFKSLKVNFQFSGLIGDREYPVYQIESFQVKPAAEESISDDQFELEVKRVERELKSAAISTDEKCQILGKFYTKFRPQLTNHRIQCLFESCYWEIFAPADTDDSNQDALLGEKLAKLQDISLNRLQGGSVNDNQVVDNNNQVVDNNDQVVDNDDQVVDNDDQVVDNDYPAVDNNNQVVDNNNQVDLKAISHQFTLLNEEKTPPGKLTLFKEIIHLCTSGQDCGADSLFPRLLFAVIHAQPQNLLSNLRFIGRFHDQMSLSGESHYVLTNFGAVGQAIDELISSEFQQSKSTMPSTTLSDNSQSLYNLVASSDRNQQQEQQPASNNLVTSMFHSIGSVPRVIGAAVTGTFNRTVQVRSRSNSLNTSSSSSSSSAAAAATATSSTLNVKNLLADLPTADSTLIAFRERMLASNSANDLQLRDIPMLLEDYKNLVYILIKSTE